jgi:hypothetical protein
MISNFKFLNKLKAIFIFGIAISLSLIMTNVSYSDNYYQNRPNDNPNATDGAPANSMQAMLIALNDEMNVLKTDIQNLRRIANHVRDYNLRNNLFTQIKIMEDRLNWLTFTSQQLLTIHSNQPRPRPQPQPRRQNPQFNFSQIVTTLENQSFDDDRLRTLKDIINGGAMFNCDQAVQIVELFTFASDQVEAAALLYNSIPQKHCFFQVINSLDYDSDRNKLRRRLGLN